MLGHTFLHISPCQFFYIGTHPLGRGRDYFFITHRFQTGDLLLLRGFLRLLFGVKFRFALGFSRLMLRTLFFFIFCGGRLCRIPLLSRLLKEMLQPELKLRRDKIRVLMAQQEIDAALITCNVNLIYTYGRVVSGYLYLPLNAPARLFIKRPNNIEGEHIHSIRKPEQLPDLLKECGLPLPAKLMLEGDELSYTEYTRLAACFPETTVVNGTPLIRKARSVKTNIEIEMFRRSGIAHTKAYEQIPSVYRPGMTDRQLSIEIERLMRLEGCLGIFRTFGQSMENLAGGDNSTKDEIPDNLSKRIKRSISIDN